MGELLRDIRCGVRGLVRNPTFTAVAIVTLVVAIGVNTALFSIVDGVLLKPLEYPHPDRLVSVVERIPQSGFDKLWLTEGEYFHLKEHSKTLSEIGIYYLGV